MSAGICGKRVGFEEIFGSSSSSAKRSRYSNFGSPTRNLEFVPGSGDAVSALLQMFPDVDPELVKSALRNHNDRVKDAVDSLRAMSFGIAVESHKSQSFCSARIENSAATPGPDSVACNPRSDQEAEGLGHGAIMKCTLDGSKWVDLFVHETMSATDLDNARDRAAMILGAFERSIVAHSRSSKEMDHALMKELLLSLLNDNQILKRAVAIQHEQNLDQEQKAREVQHLNIVLSQYKEKVRNLEMTNYTLRLHLQRAQESSSFPGHFNPDIY